MTAAAVIHLSTAPFTQSGIGAVRMCPFSNEVHDRPMSLPELDVYIG
jgi:hypothetical protein